MTDEPIAVGLVGAGPWAKMVHAPVLAAGPETRLAGVWARRLDAAERLASRHAAPAFATVDELFDNCEAVACCVPPDVQASVAVRAARAGKHLLLEKPLAFTVDAADEVAGAVADAGVASVMVLSWRYSAAVRVFLDECRALRNGDGDGDVLGARGLFVSGALLGGPFATPWRLERGPLPDLGPHVLDLLDAAAGPITSVRAHGDPRRWVGILCDHEGGAASEASLCASSSISPHRAGIEVYGGDRVVELDCVSTVGPEAFATLRAEFAAACRAGGGHPLDAAHGARLQRLLCEAEAGLAHRGG